MSLLDTASIIVTPNGYKEGKLYSVIPSDGSGDLSVTRATTATRVNSQGLVELVPYNLLSYSEQIENADWEKYQLSVTANQTTAPNGTNTADLITQTGSGAGTFYKFPYSYSSGLYTTSCYFKKGTSNVALIEGNPTSSAFNVSFNLDTQAIVISGVGTVSADIESVGNGWYRCSVVANVNASTGYVAYGLLGSTNDTMYAWGAQLVEGSVAKDYQKTETRLNIPRLDYSNGTCPSILVEPQRTNLLTYSSSFDNAAWTTQTISVTSNSTTAPDGTLTADTLTPSGSILFDNRVYQPQSVTNGVVYTLSVWAKSSVSNAKLTLALRNYGGQVFDITDQWERYSVQVTAGLLGGNFNIYAGDVTPITGAVNSSNVVTIWGAQLEAGSYATSYIPTTSASVTRNADDIKKTGVSSLIGQSEGTIFFDGVLLNKQNQYVNIFNTNKDVTNVSSWSLFWDTTNWQIYFRLYKGDGTYDSSVNLVSSQNFYNTQRLKIAVRYKNGDSVMYINGVQQATSSNSYTINGTKSELFIAEPTLYFGYQEPTECNSVALWKQGLTNAQLATLTTI